MEEMNIEEISLALKGKIFNCDNGISITGVSTDSRSISFGELFIPIKGLNFDGHDFIEDAVLSGASAVLTEKDLSYASFPYIKVKDTKKALMDLAAYYKSKFRIPFIAITGSAGKTTTKEMVSSILAESFNVLKNEGNINNTIGLPLTIFKLNQQHEVCVLEMGMNSIGEIKSLSTIVKPSIAVITNIGSAHIEKLGSRDNILKAKLEVLNYFTSEDIAILNGDDDMLSSVKDNCLNIVRVGTEVGNHIYAKDIRTMDDKGVEFSTYINGDFHDFYIPIIGTHNVYNALFAIAVGMSMGMDIDKIKKGLVNFVGVRMRMEPIIINSGIKIINDAYNANPESMSAAIEVMSNLHSRNRKVLVLADMLEQGDYARKSHYKIGALVAKNNIDILIAIGEESKATVEGALDHGMEKSKVYHFMDNDHVVNRINDILMPFDTVLFKGSRAAALEEIVEFLRERSK